MHFNADTDPAFHFNADPDPIPHQRDGNLEKFHFELPGLHWKRLRIDFD